MKGFTLAFILALFSQAAHSGDSCSSEIQEKDKVYVGCKTNVNGHINVSASDKATQIGCALFCENLAATRSDFNSVSMGFDGDGGFGHDRECSTEKLTDDTGKYTGCKINISSGVHMYDSKRIIMVDCETFCSKLGMVTKKALPKSKVKEGQAVQ